MKYERLISPHRASLILGVTPSCLRLWDIQGKITATRTLGGHRRYYLDSIMAIAPEPAMMKASLPQVQPEPEPHRGLIRRGIRRLLGKT